MARDYAYEALAEITSTDWAVGRGELNAALRDIRKQADIPDSYLLGAEIHERAKMYRQVFPGIALTPNALAKHWQRVEAESTKVQGQNLSAGAPSKYPPSRTQQNLEEAKKLVATLWGSDARDEGSES